METVRDLNDAVLTGLEDIIEAFGVVKLVLGGTVAVTILAMLAVHWLLLNPPSTDRSLVRGRWAWLRWPRTLGMRGLAALGGWPHWLLRPFGIRPVGAMSHRFDVVYGGPGRPTLLRLARPANGALPHLPPVLVIHAVVTHPWILDLTPETSLVRALAADGRDVYVLDWPQPDASWAHRGLDWYVDQALVAEDTVRRGGPHQDVHLVGYCSGATIGLIRCAAFGDRGVASLGAIAPPVDLDVPGGMTSLVSHPSLRPVMLLDGDGLVPSEVVRESFHVLRPKMLRAVLDRLRLPTSSPLVPAADALTAWLWEHRPLPGALLFDFVDLVRSNDLVNGRWRLGDRLVNLRAVAVPTMLCLATRDHVVPAGGSTALQALLTDLHVTVVGGGHISMILGASGTPSLHDELRDFHRASDPTTAPNLPDPRR